MADNTIVVLLVDDEPGVLKSLERVFADQDEFAVLTAGNTALARKILQENKVSVIISDERMPEESGTDFLATVREAYPEIPRIILTGFSDYSATLRAINDAGVFRYLQKPWNNQELLAVIREAEEYRKHQEVHDSLPMKVLAEKKEIQALNARLEAELEKRTGQLQQTTQVLKHLGAVQNRHRADILNVMLALTSLHAPDTARLARDMFDAAKAFKEVNPVLEIGPNLLDAALLSGMLTDTRGTFLPLMEKLDGFHELARLLKMTQEKYNGTGPEGISAGNIPLDARVLRMVHDYHKVNLTMPGSGSAYLVKNSYLVYDPILVKHFIALQLERLALGQYEISLGLDQLKPGMVLAQAMHLGSEEEVPAQAVLDPVLISRIKGLQGLSAVPLKVAING